MKLKSKQALATFIRNDQLDLNGYVSYLFNCLHDFKIQVNRLEK